MPFALAAGHQLPLCESPGREGGSGAWSAGIGWLSLISEMRRQARRGILAGRQAAWWHKRDSGCACMGASVEMCSHRSSLSPCYGDWWVFSLDWCPCSAAAGAGKCLPLCQQGAYPCTSIHTPQARWGGHSCDSEVAVTVYLGDKVGRLADQQALSLAQAEWGEGGRWETGQACRRQRYFVAGAAGTPLHRASGWPHGTIRQLNFILGRYRH